MLHQVHEQLRRVAGDRRRVFAAPEAIRAVGSLDLDQIPMLSVITVGLSNLVSNVPAVLVPKHGQSSE